MVVESERGRPFGCPVGCPLAERVTRHRIRDIMTVAYSNRPVSMKYRGVFQLQDRHDNPTAKADWGGTIDVAANEYYARKYELIYVGQMGQWSLQEGFDLWKERYGIRSTHHDASHSD